MSVVTHKITLNHSRKTYTIRVFVAGKLITKYRSYPQGKTFIEDWTEQDIRNFLHNGDYYRIK